MRVSKGDALATLDAAVTSLRRAAQALQACRCLVTRGVQTLTLCVRRRALGQLLPCLSAPSWSKENFAPVSLLAAARPCRMKRLSMLPEKRCAQGLAAALDGYAQLALAAARDGASADELQAGVCEVLAHLQVLPCQGDMAGLCRRLPGSAAGRAG
jgi:hypothetical protein